MCHSTRECRCGDRQLNSIILVQVKNSFDYLPAFIAHHRRFVDKIIIIDHCSDRELSGLVGDGVEVFRVSAKYFAQDMYAAYFIKTLSMHQNYDFLFLLDIDEFLPFTCSQDFNRFLDTQRNSAAIYFQWRNGFSTVSDSLDASTRLAFTKWRSPTKKMMYNLRKVGDILPVPGNHNAKYPFLDSLLLQVRPKKEDSGLGLLHVPFLGLHGLRRKIREFPQESFAQKLLTNFRYLGINVDLRLPDCGISDEDLLLFIANYRTKPTDIKRDVTASTFEEVELFFGLQDQINTLKAELASCATARQSPEFIGEEELVAKLRANRLFFFRRLDAAFGVQTDGTFAFNLPKK